MPRHSIIIAAAAVFLGACGNDARDSGAGGGPDAAEALRTQLLEATVGDVIELPAGRIELDRSLTLNVNGVTLRGAGMDKTVLSFAGQVAGAEGLLVNASNFTIEDLAIEDTVGDALKINEGHDIVIRRVRTEWTGGPDTDNGAYGIYPVQTENTLIEGSVAIGASDAGIYVGQSRNVIVRNNRAEYNVAGIEIENTIGADVHGNVVTHNTGGILVFNMPDLPMAGHSTRVYDNQVVSNNTENFAAEGTAVASVPAGSGIVVNSNDRVEIFDNEIRDNQTANILISSYFSTSFAGERRMADVFDPYPETIFIYGNTFAGGGDAPDQLELKALRVAEFGLTGSLPDIVWDGVVNQEKLVDGRLPAGLAICVDNGDAVIIDIDAAGEYRNITTDMTGHRCVHEKLPPISLPGMLAATE